MKSYDNTVWACRLFLPLIQILVATLSDHPAEREGERLSGAFLRHNHMHMNICLASFWSLVTKDNQTCKTRIEPNLDFNVQYLLICWLFSWLNDEWLVYSYCLFCLTVLKNEIYITQYDTLLENPQIWEAGSFCHFWLKKMINGL